MDRAFERGRQMPAFRWRVERELERTLAKAPSPLDAFGPEVARFTALPAEGLGHDATLAKLSGLFEGERETWQKGYVSGAVYHGGDEHVDFQNRVYALASQLNPLHLDVWPSAAKLESEIVRMTAHLLGALPEQELERDSICGTVTSGGTESILLAMKAYRDRARATGHARRVEVVLPESAHAAFDKAAELLGLTLVRVPLGPDYRADLAETARAMSRRTLVLVASAPSYPHGVVDPVRELAAFARDHEVGLHVDACLGGFVLPFAKRLGHAVPDFDFSLPGVTSISADTHKYGYAAKGTSVVLYRGLELRRYQYFVAADWQGGLYFSPTLAGSRPGALSAACWASLVSTGENGYLEATRRILDAAERIRRGIAAIPELRVLGDPLWVIAFGSDELDIYRVLDALGSRGFKLNGLQRPPSVHLAVTLRHAEPGVAERFLAALRESVAEVKATPRGEAGLAPLYGMAASFPVRGAVAELLRRFIDKLY